MNQTAADRRQKGTRLCEQLAREVAGIAPEGIGRWDRAWEIVDPADAAFMIALTKWEASGLEEFKDPLRAAYHKVLEAWRRAAAEYQANT